VSAAPGPPRDQPDGRSGRVAQVSGGVAAVFGGAALLGWWLNLPVLRTAGGIGVDMNPVLALLFLAGGASLYLPESESSPRLHRRLGRALAGVVVVLAVLKFSEGALGWSRPLERILAPDLDAVVVKPLASSGWISLLLIGLALLLVRARNEAWRLAARSVGLLFGVVTALAAGVYGYRFLMAVPMSAATQPQLNSILAFVAFSVGLTASGARGDLARRVTVEGGDALRRRVNLALAVAVGILLVIGGVSIWTGARSRQAAADRRQSSARQMDFVAFLSSVEAAETSQRGYLLSRQEEYLEPYRRTIDSIPAMLSRVRTLLASDTGAARRFAPLDSLVRARLALLDRQINLSRAGFQDSALQIIRSGQGRLLMAGIRRTVSELSAWEEGRVGRSEARQRTDDRISSATNVTAGLLAIFFLILAGRAISHDLRKRAEAEAAVEERERRLSQIIDLIPNMVFLKEPGELRFVRFNRAGEELLGFTEADLLGKNDFDFFPEEEARHFVAMDREVLAAREVVDIPAETIHTKAHGVRTLHTKKVAVRDEHGHPLFLLGISEDITDRLRTEETIREAKDAAERANRAKSDFLAKMSHELRTPLNSIIGFSEILEDQRVGALNEKQRRYVANVLLSGRNLLQLINDILDLSKVEAGRMELSPSEFDIRPAAEQVLGVLTALSEKKRLDIRLSVPDAFPLLSADLARFKQILFNLLGNAIKFTPEGGRVEFSARRAAEAPSAAGREWIEFAVADTGIGIAREDQERIFSEFEQLGSAGSADHEGTGLGLPLSRKLVELHGGRIWVESEPGRGSTFRFTLPLGSAPSGSSPAVPLPALHEFENTEGPLVLVVDDEPHARDLLRHCLREAGYRVAGAASGEEALRLARRLKPDGITLDILLPDRDGLGILAQLKADPETSGIPVVVVSVTGRRELALSLGASDWLVKPVQRPALLAALERALGPMVGAAPRTVLVVDDEAATVIYLTELLQQRGFRVLSASGGRSGIELTRADPPDVIILDLLMPDLDGFEVVRTLREDAELGKIPILILTAKELTQPEREHLRSSVQAIVPKGGREELIAELSRMCPLPRMPV
jgi:PAS domain S-box-containing protein